MLFSLIESFRSALIAIFANRMRSFLTTLGIIIGVASVISVVSLTGGMSAFIGDSFEALGSNSLTISSYTPFEDLMKGVRSRLSPEDLELIERRAEGIASITPILAANRSSQIKYGPQTSFSEILGTTYAFQDVSQSYTQSGRFLAQSDNLTRRRVAVIGEEVRDNLNLPDNPINEYIEFSGEWFKIVGLLESRGEVMGQSRDNLVLIPYSTMVSILGNQTRTDIGIQLTLSPNTELDLVTIQLTALLRDAHNLGAGEEDDFRIQTPEQLTEQVDEILGTLTLVVGGIVSISLLVGGIGIMNIMLVSVTERTREIGICKAIGAKSHHILMQFLIEAMLLSLIGGAIGLVSGYGLGVLISSGIPDFPPASVPLWATLLALGFSGAVGVLFGILPAAKASRLDPIDALRYE
ncbi:MAG: ABC transporter permease [Pseudomonadota bacterium]|nr:ABC transporter permease [Pseudomonadota bacterium]MEC8700866.1 ABC transporter permease [Pseudomonadota bacterium]